MFGKVMSVPDKAMPVYHRLILGWMPAQVKALEDGIADGSLHPNEAKMRLAREIVTIFHSADAAEAAQKRWDEVFRSGSGVPEEMPETAILGDERITDLLRRLNMVTSGGEARRLIEQRGVRLNDAVIEDVFAVVSAAQLPAVLQVGKRKFVRLVAGTGE